MRRYVVSDAHRVFSSAEAHLRDKPNCPMKVHLSISMDFLHRNDYRNQCKALSGQALPIRQTAEGKSQCKGHVNESTRGVSPRNSKRNVRKRSSCFDNDNFIDVACVPLWEIVARSTPVGAMSNWFVKGISHLAAHFLPAHSRNVDQICALQSLRENARSGAKVNIQGLVVRYFWKHFFIKLSDCAGGPGGRYASYKLYYMFETPVTCQKTSASMLLW